MGQGLILLDDIQFPIDSAKLGQRFRVKSNSGNAARLDELIDQARAISRPRAIFRPAHILIRGNNHVGVEGVRLSSRVLAVNLTRAHRIFPFVATCGTELDRWASGLTDLLDRFWAGTIMEMAMRAAFGSLKEEIRKRYHRGKMATMTPGSIDDWPTGEQARLLSLLGEGPEKIGVSLTKGMMMTPAHSLSGIRFPTETSFESCQLCPRNNCPGRRAPYDPAIYRHQYRNGPSTRE
jgi:hypothetical protein